jgi:8-oxo-dGTP diphosphatase
MIVVTAAVIDQDGRVLVARRGPAERHAGLWEFPGGKVEPGESPEQCLVRELREELELEAEVVEHLADIPAGSSETPLLLRFYETRILSGRPVLHVHDRVEWVPYAGLTSYNFLPADIGMVHLLSRRDGGI